MVLAATTAAVAAAATGAAAVAGCFGAAWGRGPSLASRRCRHQCRSISVEGFVLVKVRGKPTHRYAALKGQTLFVGRGPDSLVAAEVVGGARLSLHRRLHQFDGEWTAYVDILPLSGRRVCIHFRDMDSAQRWMAALQQAVRGLRPADLIHRLAGDLDALAATNRELTQMVSSLGVQQGEAEPAHGVQPQGDCAAVDSCTRSGARDQEGEHERLLETSKFAFAEGLLDDLAVKSTARLERLQQAGATLRDLSESVRSPSACNTVEVG
ncbi:unnamed protein product [Prorocentrum cordatum]|uniref:PH domain-containing protein n=1 Tax=Prorocentrum cordatum TaxID=2364126 RepID=A0ABN9VMJ3_9DINO|nr:unnamed protein product [Polarella glacialis]